jgi:hypothetical protein
MAPADVWREVLVLLAVAPDIVSEAVANAEDPEAVLAQLQDDIDATLSMADDPGAPRPFGVVAALLRRVRDLTDPPLGLAARLERFENCFRMLRDLDAHHRLPALAPDEE